MPEGDTIFRAARTLHRALAGRMVVRFDSMLPALTRIHEDTPITGRTMEAVSAMGKHLLMRLSGDLVLRTIATFSTSGGIGYQSGFAPAVASRMKSAQAGTATTLANPRSMIFAGRSNPNWRVSGARPHGRGEKRGARFLSKAEAGHRCV